MKTLVTGATGFVGRRLLSHLQQPVVLSRDAAKAKQALAEYDVTAFDWDAENEPPPVEAFAGVEAVIHLAGESVAGGRWNKARKERIRESRVAGTRNLVTAIGSLMERPKVLVSASAVGYYMDHGDEAFDESMTPGEGFLSKVCIDWEREAQRASDYGVRVANPRIGVVLGLGGGALEKMLTPFRWGMGSPLGNGRQWTPWVHIDDLVRALLFARDNEQVSGPFNAVSPQPETNRRFTKTLARVLRRPTFLPPVPRFMLRLLIGQFSDVMLDSQRIVPRVLEEAGFEFQHPELAEALRSILT